MGGGEGCVEGGEGGGRGVRMSEAGSREGWPQGGVEAYHGGERLRVEGGREGSEIGKRRT